MFFRTLRGCLAGPAYSLRSADDENEKEELKIKIDSMSENVRKVIKKREFLSFTRKLVEEVLKTREHPKEEISGFRFNSE